MGMEINLHERHSFLGFLRLYGGLGGRLWGWGLDREAIFVQVFAKFVDAPISVERMPPRPLKCLTNQSQF